MKFNFPVLIIFLLSSYLASISQAGLPTPSPEPIKAVNLGGWLVTEGGMTPDLFDNIPVNNDLLDGTKIQLKSVQSNNYLSAQNDCGGIITADQLVNTTRETFKLWRITETTFQFRVLNWHFFELDYQRNLIATSISSDDSDSSRIFEILRNDNDPNLIRIRAPNGYFLKVNNDMKVSADCQNNSNWEDNDPSVFVMTIVGQMQGEFQVTNGYGYQKASSIMMDHWNSFIVEDDFNFISKNGLTAVRIPVGWWIKFDSNPPRPFVGGSLQILDNAFSWAEKYNLKVIIDLHAAPGSQNGSPHSGSRDGLLSWGQNDDTIEQTIAVIDFLSFRYSKRHSLYAIELINEPIAPGVTLDSLKKYYTMGYNTIRKYSDAYVIMSNRLSITNQTELVQFASCFYKSVIDIHFYNLFSNYFANMSVQQNIDFVYNDRASTLRSMMISNGPLIFVGEWVNEMYVKNASIDDYQRYGCAQLEVYGRRTFGWAYWTFKDAHNHWNLEWMIKNEYIKL